MKAVELDTIVHQVMVAEARSNKLTLESRGKAVDLIQKSRGFLVSELAEVGSTPDEAYEAISHWFSSGIPFEDSNPNLSEAFAFLEYCID